MQPPTNVMADEYPPSTMGKLVSEILSIFQDLASYTPRPIKEVLTNYTRDKSQAELCFVSAIVIAVVVFVIVLPVLEALLRDEEECHGKKEEELTTEEEILRYYYFTQREEQNEPSSSSTEKHTMRVYSPGAGVVQMSVEELLRECSGSSCSGSSTFSSGSMETIYEDEAEQEEEDEEYDLPSPTSSPPATPTPDMRSDAISRMVSEELKKRLFHDDEIRPPLSSNQDHAPQ